MYLSLERTYRLQQYQVEFSMNVVISDNEHFKKVSSMLMVHTVKTFHLKLGKEAFAMTGSAYVHSRDAPVAASLDSC